MKRLGKENMKIIYSDQELPTNFNNTIFLAGPTPRSNNVKSWRKEAIDIFNELNYNGTLLIPEPKDGKTYPEYDNQFDWETNGLKNASCILFWIPRELRSDFENIALTTNML